MKKNKKILLTSLFALSSISILSSIIVLNKNVNKSSNTFNDSITSYADNNSVTQTTATNPFKGQNQGSFTFDDTVEHAKAYYTALFDKILEIVTNELTSNNPEDEFALASDKKEIIEQLKQKSIETISMFEPAPYTSFWNTYKETLIREINSKLRGYLDTIFKKETLKVNASIDYANKKEVMFKDSILTNFTKNYNLNLNNQNLKITEKTEDNEIEKTDKYATWKFRNQISLLTGNDLGSTVFNDYVIRQKYNVVSETDGGIFQETEKKLSIDEFKDLTIEENKYKELIDKIQIAFNKVDQQDSKYQEDLNKINTIIANHEVLDSNSDYDNPKTFQIQNWNSEMEKIWITYKLKEFENLDKNNDIDKWIFDNVNNMKTLDVESLSKEDLDNAYDKLSKITLKYEPVKSFYNRVNKTSNQKIKKTIYAKLNDYYKTEHDANDAKLQEIKNSYFDLETQWLNTFAFSNKFVANDNFGDNGQDKIKKLQSSLANSLPNVALTKELQELIEKTANLKSGSAINALENIQFSDSLADNVAMLKNVVEQDEISYNNSFWLLFLLVIPVIIIPAMIYFFINKKRNKKDEEEK
ncbi:hypothetical protein [Mycoplasma miroungirhinis]|uniref:Uncharacterized protein n=1 Tax=Mycoplasma miroungirhinis TaxID=754516 RepID=A0A6M4JG91_9MOLU|nr:hypothetical protein [Mycoplasma miroungirhinis]QJR44062.1 hypothetical protein HLA92_01250 [Mycoplasma miroungirhinis]